MKNVKSILTNHKLRSVGVALSLPVIMLGFQNCGQLKVGAFNESVSTVLPSELSPDEVSLSAVSSKAGDEYVVYQDDPAAVLKECKEALANGGQYRGFFGVLKKPKDQEECKAESDLVMARNYKDPKTFDKVTMTFTSTRQCPGMYSTYTVDIWNMGANPVNGGGKKVYLLLRINGQAKYAFPLNFGGEFLPQQRVRFSPAVLESEVAGITERNISFKLAFSEDQIKFTSIDFGAESQIEFGGSKCEAQKGPDKNFVESISKGSRRNDFDGWVGMQIKTGSNPLKIFQLARQLVGGNTQAHTVKIVDAKTGQDVPNAKVTIPAKEVFAELKVPAVLLPNSIYYLLSLEKAGGDEWYGGGSMVTTTKDASVIGGVYAIGEKGNPFAWPADPNFQIDTILSFKYRVVPPAPEGLTYSCNAEGNRVTISWKPVPGATDYLFRLDDTATSWYDVDTDFMLQLNKTSFSEVVTAGRTYITWVHGNNLSGEGPPVGISFVCNKYNPDEHN